MKFLNNTDLNKNQIRGLVADNLSAAPSSPVKGQIYYNTTENILYHYDGTSWIGGGATKQYVDDQSILNAIIFGG